MIDPKTFLADLVSHGSTLITGVPDSLLKGLLVEIEQSLLNFKHVRAVNEGNAVAIASGAYLATGIPQIVYMQNSGLGNAINPLASLAHKSVYGTPLLLIIGWRGDPSSADEPQHMVQGEITESILDSLGIRYYIIDQSYKQQIGESFRLMSETNQPVALLVKKGMFHSPSIDIKGSYTLNRKKILESLLSSIESDALIIGTTGKSSREIYEIRELMKHDHSRDFLTIGSMGHATGIATGLGLYTNKKIYVIDGDGALLMHMGSLFNLVSNNLSNIKYILINNGSHQSVGGQRSLLDSHDEVPLLIGLGFDEVLVVNSEEEFIGSFKKFNNLKKSALVIRVSNDSDESLGRPKETPIDNRNKFMGNFK